MFQTVIFSNAIYQIESILYVQPCLQYLMIPIKFSLNLVLLKTLNLVLLKKRKKTSILISVKINP